VCRVVKDVTDAINERFFSDIKFPTQNASLISADIVEEISLSPAYSNNSKKFY